MRRTYDNLEQAKDIIDGFKALLEEESKVYMIMTSYNWYGDISAWVDNDHRIKGMVVTVDENGVDIDVLLSDGYISTWESTDYVYAEYADAKEHVDNI